MALFEILIRSTNTGCASSDMGQVPTPYCWNGGAGKRRTVSLVYSVRRGSTGFKYQCVSFSPFACLHSPPPFVGLHSNRGTKMPVKTIEANRARTAWWIIYVCFWQKRYSTADDWSSSIRPAFPGPLKRTRRSRRRHISRWWSSGKDLPKRNYKRVPNWIIAHVCSLITREGPGISSGTFRQHPSSRMAWSESLMGATLSLG